MKRTVLNLLILSAILCAVIMGCEKKPGFSGTGTLVVSITDAPLNLAYVEEAKVTIVKIEARHQNDDEGYPFVTLMEDTVEVDLMDLRNGITQQLIETEVPAGEYDLLRLYVDHASIKIKDHGEFDMKVPSGAQTGIKIFIEPALSVQGALTSELLLDMDISRSFVMKGNMDTPAGIKGFNFKPVVRAVNNTTAGRIQGMVSDTGSVVLEDAEVWLETDSVIASTRTDSTGYYALIGIQAGTYAIYATKEGYDTVAYPDIKILAGTATTQDFVLTPKEE
jgi:hypothetical protein